MWGWGWERVTYISAFLVDKVVLIPNMKNYNPHTCVSHLKRGKSRRVEIQAHVIQRVIFYTDGGVGGNPKTSWRKTAADSDEYL